jgi:hypothetical protein
LRKGDNQEISLKNELKQNGLVQWLAHFAVSCATYNSFMILGTKLIDTIFSSKLVKSSNEQYVKNILLGCKIFAFIGAYKLNNFLHQKMSSEPYVMAHFWGALTSLN